MTKEENKQYRESEKGKAYFKQYHKEYAKTPRGQQLLRKRRKSYSNTLKGRFTGARYSATKKRGVSWDLSFEQYKSILESSDFKCHYCAGDLHKSGSGLDRVDNKFGYSVENVVPCCKECNWIKRDVYSSEELRVMLDALKKFRNGE